MIKFVKDSALHVPPAPSCASGGESWVRLKTSAGDTGEIALPCANWMQINRSTGYMGAVYKDKDATVGGVKKSSSNRES